MAGLAAVLLSPAARTFTLLGHSLGVEAAHARVFNNFADVEANDDPTTSAQFPGAKGAVLAIWKATVEWGSGLHGTGDGDPTQPGDIGSGGSNFDASFQGEALGVGAVGDNVHSAISSLGGGVIAATELGGGGWRIRYSDAFVWDDGTAGPVPGAIDLQTVATHEYGHALGIGHTSVSGCVMSAAASGLARDLCPDDQAAIQAVYGAAAASKPVIQAVLVDAAGAATIHGAGFAASGNEVWLTQAVPGGPVPVVLQGVAATGGGTRIEVALPPAAGPGDALVKIPGAGHATLSNAWPVDLPGGVSCGAAAYGVGLGGANLAELGAASAPAVGAVFQLALEGFHGSGPAFTLIAGKSAVLPFLGGVVLVDPTSQIALLQTPVSAGTGLQTVPIPALPALIGARGFAQSAQVDPALAGGIVLSNGLELVVCP